MHQVPIGFNFHSFQANVIFLYHLKTPKTLWFSKVSRGIEIRYWPRMGGMTRDWWSWFCYRCPYLLEEVTVLKARGKNPPEIWFSMAQVGGIYKIFQILNYFLVKFCLHLLSFQNWYSPVFQIVEESCFCFKIPFFLASIFVDFP